MGEQNGGGGESGHLWAGGRDREIEQQTKDVRRRRVNKSLTEIDECGSNLCERERDVPVWVETLRRKAAGNGRGGSTCGGEGWGEVEVEEDGGEVERS